MSNISHDTVARPSVKVKGTVLSAEQMAELFDLRVELPLDAPAQLTLRFYDELFELMDSSRFVIADDIEIGLPDATGTQHTVFVGEIVALAAEQGPNRLNELVVTAYDLGHRLGRTSQGRTFLQQSYSDVVRVIAQECGMMSSVSYLGAVRFPYLLQTSDNAAFLTDTARRTGAQWKVEKKTLKVFKPPLQASPTAQVKWGPDGSLLSFRTRFSASDWNSQVTVRGWDPSSKAGIVGNNAAQPTFLSNSPLAATSRSKANTFGKAARVSRSRAVASVSEAEEIATAFRTQTASEEVLARGECIGEPLIVPGAMVKVEGMGSRMSGNYYVTRVEHVLSNRGFVTRFTAGSTLPTSMAEIATRSSGGVTGGGLGVAIGLVCNLDDPDGQGRVKVKFPVLGDNLESDWARVTTPAAGGTRGFMMMPSVNDEVLVVFEHGDPRRPFVIGGLWNGVDKPPFATTDWLDGGKVIQWGMTTPSGHKLTFNDKKEKEGRLEVALNDSVTKFVLGKSKVELIANSKSLEIKSGQASIILSESGDVTITGQKINIDAKVELNVKGQKITASGTMVKVNADTKLDLNSNAATSIGSSGMTEVKGSIVKIN